MRESPRLTEDYIFTIQNIQRECYDASTQEIFRAIADKATAEALKWVVEDLREQRDWLEKQTPSPNTQLGHRFKQSTLRIFNKLISNYEAKLKEIEDEQPRTTRTQ